MPRQVGPFEILDKLGAGGMGEVFKARDTRLHRFVALKFLPELATAAARDRFQREALAIAALNHPHICSLYEVGDDSGRPYLVLELLEGETLRSRIHRALLDPDQILDWSLQIADALAAAHAKGILHRDLKPDNIWVASGGHLKVLDFGLARLESDAGNPAGSDATLLTSPGQTMGTVPYMSPEQARGEPLDVRSDLFSFGSVFYEMAAGRPAFPATNAADSIAAVLNTQPPKLTGVRPGLPPKIEEVAERCLEKDPDLRYQSAADLRGELKRLKRESGSTSIAAAPAARPRRRWPLAAAAVCATVAVVAGIAWFAARPSPPPQLAFRQLTFSGHIVDAVLSPDGKFLAHVDNTPQGTSLHLLSVASGSDVEIMPPAPGCCQSPSFSPDGGQVYFLDARVLKAVPVLGGSVRTVAGETTCSGAAFSPDGSQIAYLGSTSPVIHLWTARADGSQPREIAHSAPGFGFPSQCWVNTLDQPTHSAAWSPDGRRIALVRSAVSGDFQIAMVDAQTGAMLTIGPGFDDIPTTDLNWLPDGSGLIFTGKLHENDPLQVFEMSYPAGRLTRLTNDLQGYAAVSLAGSGAAAGELAMVHAAPQASIWIQAKPGGEFRQLPGGGADLDGAAGLAWTPQGGLVSIHQLGTKLQLWSEDADGANPRLLAADLPAGAYDPKVAPNGQIVLADNTNISRFNADGTGAVLLVTAAPGAQEGGPALARGGAQVTYMDVSKAGDQTMWSVPLAGGPPRELWSGFMFAFGGAVSPDGTRMFGIIRGPGGSHDPVVLHIDANPPRTTPVPGFDRTSMHPKWEWTADGSAIAYIYGAGSADNVWKQPVAGGTPTALTHFNDLKIGSYAFAADGRLAVSRIAPNQDVVLATGLHGH
ncbi:MAG TPA: protein kinase [Terriglobales bacterium]|nr:protein kinase [Terriglobales bacterium]